MEASVAGLTPQLICRALNKFVNSRARDHRWSKPVLNRGRTTCRRGDCCIASMTEGRLVPTIDGKGTRRRSTAPTRNAPRPPM